jgi:hypothetical protein
MEMGRGMCSGGLAVGEGEGLVAAEAVGALPFDLLEAESAHDALRESLSLGRRQRRDLAPSLLGSLVC